MVGRRIGRGHEGHGAATVRDRDAFAGGDAPEELAQAILQVPDSTVVTAPSLVATCYHR
jgi:hypothetical protein